MTFGCPVHPVPHHLRVPVGSVEIAHIGLSGDCQRISGCDGTGPSPYQSRVAFPRNVVMPGKVVLIGPGVAGNDAGGMPSEVWDMPSLAEARVGDGDAVNARQPTIRTISATMPRRNWGKVIGERSERWGRSLVVIARSSYGERAPRGPDAESAPLRLRTVRRIGTQHAEHGRVRPHLPEGLVHLIAIRRGLEVHVEHVLERRSATR